MSRLSTCLSMQKTKVYSAQAPEQRCQALASNRAWQAAVGAGVEPQGVHRSEDIDRLRQIGLSDQGHGTQPSSTGEIIHLWEQWWWWCLLPWHPSVITPHIYMKTSSQWEEVVFLDERQRRNEYPLMSLRTNLLDLNASCVYSVWRGVVSSSVFSSLPLFLNIDPPQQPYESLKKKKNTLLQPRSSVSTV